MAIEIDRNRRCSGARLSATSARRPCRKQDHCHFATRKATRRSVSLASDGQEQRRNFGYSEVSRVYSMVENTSRVILVAGGTGLFNAKTQRRKDAKRQRGFVYRSHIFSSSSSSFSSSPRLRASALKTVYRSGTSATTVTVTNPSAKRAIFAQLGSSPVRHRRFQWPRYAQFRCKLHAWVTLRG